MFSYSSQPRSGGHSTSRGAAGIVKPNARLCERWVTHENLSRAAEQRFTQSDRKAQIMKNSIAAPRLRNYGRLSSQGSQTRLGPEPLEIGRASCRERV